MTGNIKGVHHIALKAKGTEEYNKLFSFYHDILALPLVRTWGEGENIGAMLDTGAGLLELFANAENEPGQGAIRHMAFDVTDTDACVEAVRKAGLMAEASGLKLDALVSMEELPEDAAAVVKVTYTVK